MSDIASKHSESENNSRAVQVHIDGGSVHRSHTLWPTGWSLPLVARHRRQPKTGEIIQHIVVLIYLVSLNSCVFVHQSQFLTNTKIHKLCMNRKKTSVTARNEKDPRSRLESPRKTYFEGLTFNREAAILTICWHSSVEQVCHQLLTVTDRFIFATAYPHPLRYGSTHKPTLDFFVRSRGCL